MKAMTTTLTPLEGDLSDQELVERCLAGSEKAFAVLTERYYRPVSGFLYRRVQRGDIVEDLAQETFLEALRSLRQGRRPEQFAGWLFAIARHRVGKWLRRKQPAIFDPHAPPVDLVATSDLDALEESEHQEKLFAHLNEELARLPLETRRLLEKKHRQGKTFEELAVEEGRPVGTLKSLLARTYHALRSALQVKGDLS
jgi:RNA polymerase sigma factor (sigma-70 family)